MPWTITGQATKSLNATPRSPETLALSSLVLSLRSLAADTLTWTARTTDAAGTGTIVPDIGQQVSLHDTATPTPNRRFTGWVTDRRIRHGEVLITASGPWWFMERVPISNDADDEEGTTAERHSYQFASDSLADMLTALINRAIALGCPLTLGTIAAAFDVPRITLSLMSCADAFAELLRWLPDATAWFNYAGTGDPSLNVTRRAGATATTYTAGTDPIETLDISPRLELQVEQVDILYADRDSTTGALEYLSETSGTATATGKRQVITISGPELDTFLPIEPENFESQTPYHFSTSPAEILRFHLPGAQALKYDWAIDPKAAALNDPYSGTQGSTFYLNSGAQIGQSTKHLGTATTIPAGKSVVCFGLAGQTDPPDWVVTTYGLTRWWVNDITFTDSNSIGSNDDVIRRQAVIEVSRPTLFFSSSEPGGTGAGAYSWKHFVRKQHSDELPLYLIATADLPGTLHSGTAAALTSATQIVLAAGASAVDDYYNGFVIFWVKNGVRHGAVIEDYNGTSKVATLSIEQQADKAPASGMPYTIPEPFGFDQSARYAFLQPPAGLAANILAAQSWLPWDGPMTLRPATADFTGANLLDRKFSLANSVADAATMAALPREITWDFLRRSLTVNLGAPDRYDLRTLVNRIRRTPQDNITILT